MWLLASMLPNQSINSGMRSFPTLFAKGSGKGNRYIESGKETKMRAKDLIHNLKILRLKAGKAIHAELQHEFNAMHIYCHLCGFIGNRCALAFARKWERNVIYSHIIYRNINT
jgi:hypothetical protein